MSTLPVAGYLSDATRTNAQQKQAFEDLRSVVAQMPGGSAHAAYTLSADAITPLVGMFSVDTESGDPADDLKTIVATGFQSGSEVYLHCADASRVVTVKNSTGSAPQIVTADGRDVVLDNLFKWLHLRYDGTNWREVGRHGFDNSQRVVAKTGAYTILDSECGTTFTNEGAGAEVPLTLPPARAGLDFTFVVQNANGLEAIAGAGDTIRDGATVSAAAGKTESAEVGAVVRVKCINATEWIVVAKQRTWTTT